MMNIGFLTGLEALRLLKRNPVKYLRGVGGMYLLSVKGYELGQIARASFFFFRNLDDALDGDRKDIKNPLSHILACREQISSGQYSGKPQIVNLAKFAIERLQKKSKKGDNPKQNFLDEIDIMLFDYHRARKREMLTLKQLKSYYQHTFFPVVNLTLIGLGSKLRAGDIAELSLCQGRVYTIRDLDQDWARGVINIPKEVLRQAQLTPNASVQKVRSSQTVKKWFRNEVLECQKDLEILREKLVAANESLTARFCLGLASPLFKLSKQYLSTYFIKF